MTCQDGIYASNCIFYSGNNLACSGVNFGDSLSTAFGKIDTKLCETSTCLFKISSNDTCCGYFQTKILSGTGVLFTIGNEGACETLTISTKCNTWTSVKPSSATGTGYFRNKWRNLDTSGTTYQSVQYSDVKECIVRLRGTAFLQNYFSGNGTIMNIPNPPALIRKFSVNILIGSSSTPVAGILDIRPNGDVILFPTNISGSVTISFDGISYENS